MSSINLDYYQYNELEKICWNSFSPVNSFMSSSDLISVINNFHLKNGKFFPLPIFLDIDNDTKMKIEHKKKADLIFKNKKVGTINIEDIYKLKKQNFCKKIFGTESTKHPGVNFFLNTKEWFIGGKVSLKNQKKKKKKLVS